ncbi:MAG: 6-bladed beta-propeller [Tannerellaceae bacterium]|jgi:hypothetical protein|nr:6-bladed beta-propeller [Tannerellaceae bacterium]
MRKKIFSSLIIVLFFSSCRYNNTTEKHHNERNNIVNIHDKIKEITIENPLISSSSRVYIIDKYLIIEDLHILDTQIHLFDKNTFEYIISTAARGQGPCEITRIGHIGIDEMNRKFYVSDHGKNKIFGFLLDSVLGNSSYCPEVKVNMNNKLFPSEYEYINDTLCIGRFIEPIEVGDFKPTIGRWNMNTGEVTLMKYKHPEVEKKRIVFAISTDKNLYVEFYNYHDLLTICNLDGELQYNIYGPKWDNKKSNKIDYFHKGFFKDDNILVLYTGEEKTSTKIIVFNVNGDYIKTLETKYSIRDFCYDKENNRLIMNLDDEIQFAYLELDGIV